MISIPPQPHEEPTGIQVGPIRLVAQCFIHADDPDAHTHVGEIVRGAMARAGAGRGPATGLVVQIYSAELVT